MSEAIELYKQIDGKIYVLEEYALKRVRVLRGALKELERSAPSCDCTAMDHSGKGNQHGIFQPCPPLRRYEQALEQARAALTEAQSNG